jgi:UDP-glucose 4-epimerase
VGGWPIFAEVDEFFSKLLGSGHGHSVLEVLEVFGLAISYVVTQWRSGDAVITVAEHTEADQLLIWQVRCG